MRERKTKKFRELLLQYEAMTNREKANTRFFFTELMPKAKSFSDWTVIFHYGGDTVRKDALWKMKLNAIRGKSREEIQLNILELFIVLDSADQADILKRYLRRFHKEQDFLFVMDEVDWTDYAFRNYINDEMEKYDIHVDPFKGKNERLRMRKKLLKKSTFNPPSWT